MPFLLEIPILGSILSGIGSAAGAVGTGLGSALGVGTVGAGLGSGLATTGGGLLGGLGALGGGSTLAGLGTAGGLASTGLSVGETLANLNRPQSLISPQVPQVSGQLAYDALANQQSSAPGANPGLAEASLQQMLGLGSGSTVNQQGSFVPASITAGGNTAPQNTSFSSWWNDQLANVGA